MTQCQACDTPAPSGVSICPRCQRDTEHRLTAQEFYRQQLLVVLTRATRTQALNDGGRAASLTLAWAQIGDRFLDTIDGAELRAILASLPPARRAADALHSQRSLLVSWCRDLHDKADVPLPADDTVAMVAHLHSNMAILRKHVAAGEFVHELRSLVNHMLRVIDLPEERTRITVGPCPHTYPDDDGHEAHCAGEVEAIIPSDVDEPAVMKCGACRVSYDTTQWTRAGRLIQARRVQLERQKDLARQFIGKA